MNMKTRRILAVVVASALSLGVVSVLPTVAEEVTPAVVDMNIYGARATDESYFKFVYEDTDDDDGYAVVTGLTTSIYTYDENAPTDIVIPSEVDNPNGDGKIPVTKIASSAFYGHTELMSVVIPGSITSVGFDPFDGCTNLTTVILCEGTTEIYRQLFNLTYITTVVIPSSVTFIEENTFVRHPDACDPLVLYYAGTEEEWSEVMENSGPATGLNDYELICNVPTSWFDPDLGDVDDDGSVTPVDAHKALVAYASEQVGQDTGLTDEEMNYADVDGDGSVSPLDAHYMLLYYATQQVQEGITWLDILL